MFRFLIPCCTFLIVLSFGLSIGVYGQYFGKNKVGYRSLEFKKMDSPNFELYYYTSDSSARYFLSEAEKWYRLHSHFLSDSIKKRNPLILYDNHSDFQQTTVFDFTVSVGTGGITEGLKNRVVMPYTHANEETNHVLGHELVHAFQYNILKTEDSLSLSSIENLPLWMVEGLAEFLSIGRLDPHTAMWMRDAIHNDYFPTLRDLNQDPRYFPYRYGHAFWSFVTGVWGDQVVRPLFVNTAQFGLERALAVSLGYSASEVSQMWRRITERYYQPLLEGKESTSKADLFNLANAGKINLTPSISPDGQKIIFLSEKNVISLDLYLADVPNKKIIRKISSLNRASHIDFVGFYESSATWSPDSRQFAIITFARGRNQITIMNAKTGKIVRELEPAHIRSIKYPSWSPDGRRIAFSGMSEGVSDIYVIDLVSEEVHALTQDNYSDLHPSWHPSENKIVFATDRLSLDQNAKGGFNLSILDLNSQQLNNLSVFPGAFNMNPFFTSDGRLLFLSDRDGYRNLYAYDFQTQSTYLMTNYISGISGITKYSSAVSFCPSTATLYYNLYHNDTYSIVQKPLGEFRYLPVSSTGVEQNAGYLPPRVPVRPANITKTLHNFASLPQVPGDSIQPTPYQSKFRLDYVTSAGFGVGSSSLFGTFATGGILLGFSDILGQNQMFSSISLNGELIDVSGGVAYINKKKRIDWGGLLSHTPFLSAQQRVGIRTIEGLRVQTWQTDIIRTFQENLELFAFLPFSRFHRLQANLGAYFYHYRIDRYTDDYIVQNGVAQFWRRNRSRVPSSPNFSSIWVYSTSVAYVGDNSYSGLVGPLDGYRYRLQIGQYFGNFTYTESTLDGRWYRWLRPVGLALRGLHIGRYGKGGENERIYPLNVAFPTLVRGYNYLSAYRNTAFAGAGVSGQFNISDFLGSMIWVANAELRLPFTGVQNLSLIHSKFFLTEWALFFDAGMAYASSDYKALLFNNPNHPQSPIFSTGVSLRVNLFGIYIIEPFYAFPFQRPDYAQRGILGFNLFPAW